MDQEAARAVSRRKLVLAMAGGTALAGMIAVLPNAEPLSRQARRLAAGNRWTRGFISLAHADMNEWAAQTGSVLRVAGGWSLRLAGVRALPSEGARPSEVARRHAFVAVFDVLHGMEMPGDLIYTAAHRDYGAFELFLTAAGGDGPTRRMHAVFN